MIYLDTEALDAARRRFNIHDRVQVIPTYDMGLWCDHADNTWGLYKSWHQGTHIIIVRERLDHIEASRTIFHELTHAKQAELAGSFAAFMGEYVRQLREARADSMWRRMLPESEYLRNRASIPWEQEAIEVSNALVADGEVALPCKCPTQLIQWRLDTETGER